MKVIAALYRQLLRLFPPDFRRRFGDEIAEGFSRGLRARATATARAAYLAAAAIDLPRSIAGEWWRLAGPALRVPRDPHARRGPLDMLRQDLRDARRSLRQRPGYVAAVVLTLALGIGANVAVFTLVDAVLLRPLPIADPGRVVAIFNTSGATRERSLYGLDGGLSYASFRTLEQRARSLSAVAGFIDVEVGLQSDRGVRQLTVGAVSGRYFELLGLTPAAGRVIGAADDGPGPGDPVVVLSDAFWRREFDRDPAVLGRTLRLGGTTFMIVGIAPPRFRGTRLSSRPELWVPIRSLTSLRAGGIWMGTLGQRMLGDHPLGWVMTLGRLGAGVSLEQATTELDRQLTASRGAAAPPSISGIAPPDRRALALRPVVEAATLGDRRSLVGFVVILLAVVGLTLLIACMNVANLVFVRSAQRTRELALRAALGAGRLRLIWMLAVEHLLLALLAAAGAIGVGAATMRLLSAFMLPGDIPLADLGPGLDPRVFAIALVLAIVTTIVFGLGPAIRASAPSSRGLLGARGAGGRRSPHGLLIAGQVALTLVLLVGAALFVRSLRAGLSTDFGFDASRLAAASFDLFRYGYDGPRARTYYEQALARAAALPAASGAALTTHVPLSALGTLPFDTAEGPYTTEHPLAAGLARVTDRYFDIVGIPLFAGRTFLPDDTGPTPPAVLNESAARALFGAASPLGRRIRLYGERESIVVGVVRDASVAEARDRGAPIVYQSFRREIPTGGVSLIVRSDRPAAALGAMRRMLHDIDPVVALHDERLVSDMVDRALMPQRFGTMLLSLFAAIALAVAAVGIYSVVAFTVSQRTAELGIRVALGAQDGDVLRVVLGRSGLAVAAGVLFGAAAAVPASGALGRFLYDIQPLDRLSFGAAGALLVLAAIAAMILPARRAMRTDPLIALRNE